MPTLNQNVVRNHLLRAMTPEDFGRIESHLRPMTVTLHQVLIASNTPIERLFFPESGFTSMTTDDRGRVEIGLIGREGIVGMAALLADDQTPYEHFIQAAGDVLSIDRAVVTDAFEQSPSLRRLLLRYIHTFTIQMGQTAFVNATYDVEARLVRWLLMCQDRIGGTELTLTHEFLSMMLGVQRTSVTLSLQILEGSGLIRARRGRIEIRDRERMIVVADKGYGAPEAAYERLIGA